MNRSLLRLRPTFAVLVAIIGASAAQADSSDTSDVATPDVLRNFRFISSLSTVEIDSGPPATSVDWNVAGKFGFATGYDGVLTPTPTPVTTPPVLSGHASFVNVDAYLFHAPSSGPAPALALDLDSLLNLSGLKGTFKVPGDIHFTGDDGQGIPIQLEAVIHGPLMRLTGATLAVPTCASCGINGYKINAFATLAPYADFNLDGVVDSKDLHVLMSNIGMQSGATFEQGDADGNGTVDGTDFLLWQRSFGAATSLSEFSDLSATGTAVPEPTTLTLIAMLAALFVAPIRNRKSFAEL